MTIVRHFDGSISQTYMVHGLISPTRSVENANVPEKCSAGMHYRRKKSSDIDMGEKERMPGRFSPAFYSHRRVRIAECQEGA